MASRFLPFLVFGQKGTPPLYIQYLGRALPAAIFGFLVIFCLKDVDFAGDYHGLPELLALLVTIALHHFKREITLSMASGTLFYMLLLRANIFS